MSRNESEALFTRGGTPTKATHQNDKGQPIILERKNCSRCGGVGGSDKWKHTGWTCYDCSGKGWFGEHRQIRLFTQAELDKLNATQAKRDATRARKAAEKAALEEARRAGERQGCMERNAAIVKLLRRCCDEDSGEISDRFLGEMLDIIQIQARDLTPGQEEAARKGAERFLAEKARLAKAAHVGIEGERMELELRFERRIRLQTDPFEDIRFLWLFRTPEGSSVLYFGGYVKAFDSLPEERVEDGADSYYRPIQGSSIRIAAGIKAHRWNGKTGEPETLIQRPALKAASK